MCFFKVKFEKKISGYDGYNAEAVHFGGIPGV
jgi:hypothetical protein